MDIEALKGIADAVEAESKQPSPSHNNLARLLAMFIRELIKEKTSECKIQTPLPVNVTTTLPIVEMDEPKKKPKKSK